jgi:hypothetical protein
MPLIGVPFMDVSSMSVNELGDFAWSQIAHTANLSTRAKTATRDRNLSWEQFDPF